MRESWQELSRCMAEASLWGAPNLMRPLRSRRCSWGHSASWTCSPSAEPWAREAAKQPREDSSMRWFGLQKWHSWSRHRSGSRQCQSPHQSAEGDPPHHLPVLQGLVLQVSGCVFSVCKTWSYRPGLRSPEVGYGKVGHLPWLKTVQRSKSSSTSPRN